MKMAGMNYFTESDENTKRRNANQNPANREGWRPDHGAMGK
jgi:hypothetical protein